MQFYHSMDILGDLKVILRKIGHLKNGLYLISSDFLFDCWQVPVFSWL